jgi:hypothetical protein
MAFEKYYDVERPTRLPACIHLRSKAMYVTGDIKNPNHPDEEGSQYCWCNKTQHVVGPDQVQVERCSCVPGRECYCDTYDV